MSWRKEVERWPARWRGEFEERAAIREFDGGQARGAAEFDAYRDTRRDMAAALAADQEARRGRA